MEKSTPYYIWRDIIRDLFNLINESTISDKDTVILPIQNSNARLLRDISNEDIISSPDAQSPNPLVAIPSSAPNVYTDSPTQNITSPDPLRKISLASEPKRITKPHKENADDILASSTSKPIKMRPKNPLYDNSIYSAATVTAGGNEILLPLSFELCIRKGLQKLNLDESSAHLFEIIFPSEFQESPVLPQFHGKMRMRELHEIIRRIIIVLSGSNPLVFMFHEMQWVDHLSWMLLTDIACTCPKIMICISTRPEQYYDDLDT